MPALLSQALVGTRARAVCRHRRSLRTRAAVDTGNADESAPPEPKKSVRKIRSLSKKDAGAKNDAPASGTPASDLAAKKAAAVQEAMKKINKELGSNAVYTLDSKGVIDEIERIPTGCLTLDSVLGGGIARGRVIEIFGPESCGKTSLALCIMARALEKYPTDMVALFDLESAYDSRFGKALGIEDESRFIYFQPATGEACMSAVEHLIVSGGVSVVTIDSVAALVPESEISRDLGDAQVGVQARFMSSSLRRLHKTASDYNVTLIYINQIRQKVGVMYGNPETTPGGLALKFYASQRVDLRRKEIISSPVKEGPALGIKVRAKIVKNKTAPPLGEATFDFLYKNGIDKYASTVDGAVMAGVISRRGAYFSYGDEVKVQGRAKMIEFLQQEENAELHDKIYQEALNKLSTGEVAADDGSDDMSE